MLSAYLDLLLAGVFLWSCKWLNLYNVILYQDISSTASIRGWEQKKKKKNFWVCQSLRIKERHFLLHGCSVMIEDVIHNGRAWMTVSLLTAEKIDLRLMQQWNNKPTAKHSHSGENHVRTMTANDKYFIAFLWGISRFRNFTVIAHMSKNSVLGPR